MDYTFQFGTLANYLPRFISGFWLTMLLASVGIFGGIALMPLIGLAIAWVQMRPPPPLSMT